MYTKYSVSIGQDIRMIVRQCRNAQCNLRGFTIRGLSKPQSKLGHTVLLRIQAFKDYEWLIRCEQRINYSDTGFFSIHRSSSVAYSLLYVWWTTISSASRNDVELIFILPQCSRFGLCRHQFGRDVARCARYHSDRPRHLMTGNAAIAASVTTWPSCTWLVNAWSATVATWPSRARTRCWLVVDGAVVERRRCRWSTRPVMLDIFYFWFRPVT